MPNYCENLVTLTHTQSPKLVEAVENFDKEKLLSYFAPMPDFRRKREISKLLESYEGQNNFTASSGSERERKVFKLFGLQPAQNDYDAIADIRSAPKRENSKLPELSEGQNNSNGQISPAEIRSAPWYYWCTKNWGTKWDIYDMWIPEWINSNSVRLSFCTASSPPLAAYDQAVERHGFSITADYNEPNMDFCGKYEPMLTNDYYDSTDSIGLAKMRRTFRKEQKKFESEKIAVAMRRMAGGKDKIDKFEHEAKIKRLSQRIHKFIQQQKTISSVVGYEYEESSDL